MLGSRPVQSALGLPPVQADQESLVSRMTSPMIGLTRLTASLGVSASVEGILLGGKVSMITVTNTKSSTRSSNELSGALDEGLDSSNSLNVDS